MGIPNLELVHGVEKQFFTNHVAHFMLITRLLDLLDENGRVVLVSSDLHKNAPGIDFTNLDGSNHYDPIEFYNISKLANVLFAKSLSRKFSSEGTHQKAFAVHSGLIPTNILRYQNMLVQKLFPILAKFFFKNVSQGAATQCFAAVHPKASAPRTSYLVDCKESEPHPCARDINLQDRLWEETEKIIRRIEETK